MTTRHHAGRTAAPLVCPLACPLPLPLPFELPSAWPLALSAGRRAPMGITRAPGRRRVAGDADGCPGAAANTVGAFGGASSRRELIRAGVLSSLNARGLMVRRNQC